MSKVFLAMMPWVFTLMSYKAMAQDEPSGKEGKKEREEIIIRKNGDRDVKITVEINGDQVMINGKPLMEFNDDGVTINKRKVIIRDGNRMMFSDGDMPGGFSWSDGKPEKRAFLGVSTEKSEDGAKVMSVTEGSGAEKAGLQKDDIITKVNGKSVSGPEELADIISAMKPGEEVKINYKRNGKGKSLKATLGERTVRGGFSTSRSFSMTGPDGSFKTFTIPSMPGDGQWKEMLPEGSFDFGDRFKEFDFEMNSLRKKQKLGIRIQDTEESNGVKILDVEESSAAATAGLQKDDVITEIAGVKVTNTDEARQQLMENSEKTSYSMKAKRNGTEMSFNIKIPKKLKTANL